jgi:hypothetical protein
MRSLFSLLILAYSLGFFSCRNSHAYDKYVKELDSLKVVLQQAVTNFKTVDSTECVDAYSKHYTYSLYLNSHLKDTVTKTVAENLQNFQSVEKGIQDYLAYRSSWLIEADLSITQLHTLSHDLKSGSIDEEEAVEFINEEKKQAEIIIEELKLNTKAIRKHLTIFHQSIPTCENLVKELNNGILPELVHPEIKRTN